MQQRVKGNNTCSPSVLVPITNSHIQANVFPESSLVSNGEWSVDE